MKASINVHDSRLKSLERGNQMVKSFVGGCSNDSETHVFYSLMSRSPLNTFDDTTKTSKLKCKSGDFVKAHINPVKIVRRALVLVNVRENETVVRILAYPIGPIPSALFHDDGTMWKCCKCDIIQLLEEEICSSFNLPSYNNIYQSTFIASLYDPNGKFRYLHDDLNKLRVEFVAAKDASLVKIPPCENTFLRHIPRVMLQTQVWINSHIAKPVIILSKDSGW
ncbi:unnamed protein product [Mytilus coruscus]|uniref:Uncharacterized protein n=1 Tax=Mytilus coruscus TaxID=42192 RepID=A0A6J8CI68_MYTCO|nr:unnamed protein product [Mytilus coruscus]